jgi:predicted nucleic acid-binding Zn ribbon protein
MAMYISVFLRVKMKRTNTMSIAQVIGEVLGDYKIADKFKEARIIAAWTKVLGSLAKPTDQLYIKNNVLFANVSSSVIRNELYMRRSKIVQLLNENAGEEVIKDIIFR